MIVGPVAVGIRRGGNGAEVGGRAAVIAAPPPCEPASVHAALAGRRFLVVEARRERVDAHLLGRLGPVRVPRDD